MQAALFRRLREHYQKRDQLRLTVDYRKKYLESLVRGGEEEARQAEENFAQARAQTDRDYEESAAAVAEKKELSADEEAELNRLWRKLVKLYHPDRFAHEPDKLATYEKLTAAINRAKETGDIQTLHEIADDPAKCQPSSGCATFSHPMGEGLCGRAGRAWISATKWNWQSCGGCMNRCNWKSSR